MVGAVKRWLGIDVLERENLKLARSMLSLREALKSKTDADETKELASRIASLEKGLTAKPEKPKIEPRPKRMTWRGTLAAIENEQNKESEK